MIDSNLESKEDNYYFLFLTYPFTTHLKLTNYFKFKFINEKSTLKDIQDHKIYMCGYRKSEQGI
jgi:hypothetical protein